MLTCSGCIRHCLQTLIGDSVAIQSTSRTSFNSLLHQRQSLARSYSTYSTSLEPPRDSWPKSPSEKNIHDLRRKLEEVPDERQQWLDSRGVRTAWKPRPEQPTNREINKHLVYLKDPLKLSTFVRQTLRAGDFDLAQELVRAASKDTLCTVSWNHLVDFQLQQGKMNAAIKTYNEMKKRRQFPDGHTYTILFRGCAQHPDSRHALEKVMKIYQSMLTEKSLVKPTAIHMNAVLKMCARAKDVEAMFTIMSDMPEWGHAAPNTLTFTTVFNALRLDAVDDVRGGLTPIQQREKRQKYVLDARQLWADVIRRWRKGDMRVDEELVCSMGRLLLIGEDQDFDDIFSLVEQTMQIPRQLPRRGTRARLMIEPAYQGRTDSIMQTSDAVETTTPKAEADPTMEESGATDAMNTSDAVETTPKAGADRTTEESGALVPLDPFSDVYAAWAPGAPPPEGPMGYATPGQNTLSLLVQASNLLKKKEAGVKYWQILTQENKIKPDAENYHSYLRILRVNRASSETVQVLLNMPRADMQVKTFRISMATCSRDKLNHHAFSNSGKILDLMQTVLKEPDIPTCLSYLDTAINAPVMTEDATGHRRPSKLGQGRQILRALDRLNPSFLNLKSILDFDDPLVLRRQKPEQVEFVDNVLTLTRRMISAYDIIMNQSLVGREWYGEITKQRSKLAAFVTRHKEVKAARSKPEEKEPLSTPNIIRC